MALADWLRATIAIQVLQAVGIIYLCYHPSKPFGLFPANGPAAVPRHHALSVALVAMIRFVLLIFFDNKAIHISHIVVTAQYTLHMVSEIFLYQSIELVTPTIVEIVINCSLMILLAATLNRLCAQPEQPIPRRRGRLFASHHMEGDLLVPPDTPEVRELKKKN